MNEQVKDLYGSQTSSAVEFPGQTYNLDRNGFLVGEALSQEATQKIFPISLQARLLYQSHYPTKSRIPCKRYMYDPIRRQYYWTQNENVVKTAVKECWEFVRNQLSEKRRRTLQLFTTVCQLESVAVDTPGPLPRTSNGNLFELVKTGRYMK